MNIEEWANKWDVSDVALYDLMKVFGINTDPAPNDYPPGSEAAIQTIVRLEASQAGYRLWRNNVGAVTTEDGRHIRFGLCNDSVRMNKMVKSSDLIGIKPIVIKQEHVGTIIGQFLAREVKHGNWNWTGSEREIAQLHFHKMITALGGDAKFATGRGTL